MKTTLDIPDSVYREFKVKTAMNGETMRNATLAFIVAYNNVGGNPLDSLPQGLPRKAASNRTRLPTWAGVAEKMIRRYPEDPLDAEAMRDAIVAARRKGLS